MSALDSYGATGQLGLIPAAHFRFLARCLPFFETEGHFIVHANYRPDVPLNQQDDHTLCWLSLQDFTPGPHGSGKVAVLGHSPQNEVLDLKHLICLDTNCCDGGWLTALDVVHQQKWQVDESGHSR